ncbi:hypothetical protein C8F04DRAFT_1195074 [Mycena alexandri]|uniref:Uncharacterized protein n=1 Tax=Mycena alexandri TaxID=1745969 RepID=A0AAD6WQZ5_9AGAR|nr:hypothetical protein C8F04DRAFT_1195074 [Mycena alexandri]
MLLTDSLSVGQLTFILRLVIQVLNYGGLFILGLIIASNAPRVAPLGTHDVLNRIVGIITSTKESLRWCAEYVLGQSGGSPYPSSLLVAVILSTVYVGFAALSDVAFLGFHTCTTPFADYYDFPSSIGTDRAAMEAVVANLVDGTDPASVKVSRCDSSTLHDFGSDMYGVPLMEYICDNWTNSTLVDRSFYQNLNFTDTAVLMNAQLRTLNLTNSSSDFYLNTFAVGVGNTRTRLPTIQRGIFVEPHATGARAVLGVPNLPPDKSIVIDKTMLMEVDMGCMELGLFTQMNLDTDEGFDTFATDWKNNYTGPEVLQPIVQKYSAVVRDLVRPLFNESSRDENGFLYAAQADNFTSLTPLGGSVGATAQISTFLLPPSMFDIQLNMTMNCTADVYGALNITLLEKSAGFDTDPQCGMFGVTGSFAQDGVPYAGMSRFFCATATQVNMASATITTDALGTISATHTRLPSDLHYVAASWWKIVTMNGTNFWINYTPFERFVLSSSAASHQTNHYIAQYGSDSSGERSYGGPGAAGSFVSRLGSYVMNWNPGFADDTGMSILEDGTNYIDFNASIVPAWGGKLAGALIRNSLAYNGFAAQQGPQTLVSSTGGRPAVCYDLRYGAAVMPLFIAAAVAILWSAFILTTTAFKGSGPVKRSYGGVEPLRVTLCPKWALNDATLAWQNVPEPHLEAVEDGDAAYSGCEAGSAASYLSKGPEIEDQYVDG